MSKGIVVDELDGGRLYRVMPKCHIVQVSVHYLDKHGSPLGLAFPSWRRTNFNCTGYEHSIEITACECLGLQ